MAQNHFEYARNLPPVQKYAHLNVALFSGPDDYQNGHFPYESPRFAGQLICSDQRYNPELLQMPYSHPHPPSSHSLPPPLPGFWPNQSGSHRAGTDPHQLISDQFSPALPMDLVNDGQWILHRESTHPVLEVLVKPVQKLNKPKHLLQTLIHGSVSGQNSRPSFQPLTLQFHGLRYRYQSRLNRR